MSISVPSSGFDAVCQKYIQSKPIASNFYKKSTYAAILGALTIGNQQKDSLSIGRPGIGEILSGANIPEIQRLRLGSINEYVPRIQGFKTQNTRELDVYDDLPGTVNQTTNAPSQADQYGAGFRWGEIVTEIKIWHEDKMRWLEEGTADGAGLAAVDGLQHATEVAIQDHIDALIENLWNGNPASQTASLWKSAGGNPFVSPGACLGVMQMTSATNTYGRIDRSNAANATLWAASVDSTLTTDNVQAIIDDFKYTKGLSDTGSGPYLMIVPNNQFVKFKAQAKASHTIIEQMPDGLVKMAKMGALSDCIRVDDFYIVREPWLTTNGFTQTVVILDASTIKVMFHPKRNFSVGKFTDQTDYGDNPSDLDRAFIRTRFMHTNDNPVRSARYTAIVA
jgi:hypothetical protein